MDSLRESPRQVDGGRKWAAPVACFLLVLGCHCWQMGASPLAGTEGNRVLPAHLMVETGQWLVPTYYSQTYLRKPILHYWALAAAETVSGSTEEWVYRLPSALGAAFLAAFLAAMGQRWFGRPAGWVAGLGFFSLVALWSQSRSADIDSLNTLATVVTACALLDLGFGPEGRRAWLWCIFAGLSFAAMLLLKGPGGLPVVIGALAGPGVLLRRWRWLARPRLWLALILGGVLTSFWVYAVWHAIRTGSIPPDPTGLSEAGGRVMVLRKIPLGLLTMVEVWLYTMPIGLALIYIPLLRRRVFGGGLHDQCGESCPLSTRTCAAAGACLFGLLVYAINGIDNPRYTYPAIPLMALVFAGVATAWQRGYLSASIGRKLRIGVPLFALFICVLQTVLIIRLWSFEGARASLVFSWLLVLSGTAVWCAKVRRRADLRSLAWGLLVFVALYVPVATYKMEKSFARSSKAGALQVKAAVPEGESYAVGYIHNKPEFFFYADRHVEILGLEAMRDTIDLQEPQWMVLRPYELEAWEERYPGRILSKERLSVPRYNWHLVRYDPRPR